MQLKTKTTEPKSPHLAFAVVGMPGVGKSTVSGYLQSKGWDYVRFGQVTIDEVRRRGLPINETSERAVREELRSQGGMAVYAELSWPRIQNALRIGPLVIDGLYSWSEYLFLRKKLEDLLIVLAIVAPREIRYARLAARSVRPLSRDEAEERDIGEIEQLEKAGPIAMADFTILNECTPEQLQAKLVALLEFIEQCRHPNERRNREAIW